MIQKGLSPRVRGNREEGASRQPRPRSIPACAGEPSPAAPPPPPTPVYPRVCGGTGTTRELGAAHSGLSPRVRGNRSTTKRLGKSRRSIPACAGEPALRSTRRYPRGVYPRVCGGTPREEPSRKGSLGLSPRVRGNPVGSSAARGKRRSIPACAGEPIVLARNAGAGPVYPRVCGGTCASDTTPPDSRGLSPRVRGNLEHAKPLYSRVRSIPACAGEPIHIDSASASLAVYPRVCGGTLWRNWDTVSKFGLSPRVRGNRPQRDHWPHSRRSIPACAGEPRARTRARAPAGVYPRVCGGTRRSRSTLTMSPGLSPRVRGNHDALRDGGDGARSIPACAGEPRPCLSRRGLTGVYPRVCGGTGAPPAGTDDTNGLSPRVRGNPALVFARASASGSIPACAGEPSSRRAR